MEIDSCDAKRSSVSQDVSIAQIVTAITTVFYAAVFAIGYYMMIGGNPSAWKVNSLRLIPRMVHRSARWLTSACCKLYPLHEITFNT